MVLDRSDDPYLMFRWKRNMKTAHRDECPSKRLFHPYDLLPLPEAAALLETDPFRRRTKVVTGSIGEREVRLGRPVTLAPDVGNKVEAFVWLDLRVAKNVALSDDAFRWQQFA